MCLLVNQPKTTNFTDAFLTDVFTKNSDGLGVMYAEDGKIHVYKCLPANAQDFIDFYRKHAEGRDCVWHARMQTHGDIDMDNCHPYQVTDDIWLAHNGVLGTGNKWDKSKSDTWHFIRNVLRPALSHNPDLILDPAYQEFLGDVIGRQNKFGLVRADGKTVIINESSGVNFVGAWLSNTYAWSTTKFGFRHTYSSTGPTAHGYYGIYGDDGFGYDSRYSNNQSWYSRTQQASSSVPTTTSQARIYEEDEGQSAFGVVELKPQTQEAKGSYEGTGSSKSKSYAKMTKRQITPFVRALYNQWSRHGLSGIETWVKDAPYKAAAVLSYWYSDVEDIELLVNRDPEEAAVWLEDLFRTDSVTPSMY